MQNAVLWQIETDVVIGFDGDTRPEPGCIERMMEDLNELSDQTPEQDQRQIEIL